MYDPAPHWDIDVDHDLPKAGPVFTMHGEGWTEDFHCLPVLAGGTLARMFAAAVGTDERGRRVFSSPDIPGFIEDCLREEEIIDVAETDDDGTVTGHNEVIEPADDIERWRALMDDKKRPIHTEDLGDVFSKLITHYTKGRSKARKR